VSASTYSRTSGSGAHEETRHRASAQTQAPPRGLPPREHLRPYDIVAEPADTVTATRLAEYDIRDLVAVLAESGIKLARNTVRNYLSLVRRARAARSRAPNPDTTPTVNSTIEAAAHIRPTPGPPPHGASRVLANDHTRACALRESNSVASPPRAPGRFDLIPDSDMQTHGRNMTAYKDTIIVGGGKGVVVEARVRMASCANRRMHWNPSCLTMQPTESALVSRDMQAPNAVARFEPDGISRRR
jgi:hypothetical protein